MPKMKDETIQTKATREPIYKWRSFWAVVGFLLGVMCVLVIESQPTVKNHIKEQPNRTHRTESSSVSSTTNNGEKTKTASTSTIKAKGSELKSVAWIFGTQPVTDLQDMPYLYEAKKVDDGMQYIWQLGTDAERLVRVDTDDGYTNVYKYEPQTGKKVGDSLFTGQTIVQRFNTR